MNIYFQPCTSKSYALRVCITQWGKLYRKSLGISAPGWDQKKQKCGNLEIDGKVKKIRIGLESTLDDLSTKEDILKALDRIQDGQWKEPQTRRQKALKEPKIPTFKEFFKEWSERDAGAKNQNRLTYNVVDRLMGLNYDWDELDSAFYAKLIKKFDAEGFRPNYQGTLIGRIKTCLNEAFALHYIKHLDFREWKKPREATFAIALSDQQVEAIENYETKSSLYRKVIDLFTLGIHTASRFSDYSRLSLDDIQDNKIRFVQEKTEAPVVIPCSPKVRAVLEKNGGHAPAIESQVFNRNIKLLCKKIGEESPETGLAQPIQVPPTIMKKLGREPGEPVYRYELISSHTCRRTAITKLYRDGVPTSLIRRISGHKTESQLMKYIKISAEDTVSQLAELDFFK